MSEVIHKQPIFEPITPAGAYCQPDSDLVAHGHCTTCSDEALPARVLQVDEATLTAVVLINGQSTEIDISLVDEVAAGQTLLVHGGVALEKLEIGD